MIKKYSPIILLLILPACGIWTNFTTFFNLYYNTRELYYEVQEDMANLAKDPFQLKEPDATPQIKNKLNKLQEKTSRILQHESESAFFDDAVFISGWAFYTNGDYLRAIRKFQELLSLDSEEYELLCKMYIGKSELQLRNFSSGIGILNEVRDSAKAKENNEVLKEVYKTIIAYHIDREEYNVAVSQGRKLIEISNDNKLNAQVAYRIGLIYLETGDEQEAVSSFESVLNYSPDFTTEFNSRFEIARLMKKLGRIDESRDMLNRLYNEGKYSTYWGDVFFELGLIEYENENYDKAFDVFSNVNKLYPTSKGAMEAQLMQGEIMRNVYADYDSAKVYYDKVKGSNTTPEIKAKAELYSQSIMRYITLRDNINRTERQITYLLEPVEFVRDSLAYLRFLAKSGAEKEGVQTPAGAIIDTSQIALTDTSTISDTTSVAISSQDSLFAFSAIDFSFDDDYILEKKPEYPKIGLDSLQSRIGNDYFALGNLFFTDLLKLDSAYYYYNLLIDKFPNFSNKPRVLFALGTYYETNDQLEKANELYSIVYDDYKTHPLANEAAKKLNKPLLRTESDPAEEEYLLAEELIGVSDFDSAIYIMKEIVKNYPESIYKAKSLYTIGWLYENEIDQPDSAITYYKKVLETYRYSDFALVVVDKVNIYNAEQERIQREKKEAEKVIKETSPVDNIDHEDNPDQVDVPIEEPQAEPEPVDSTQLKDH